MEYPTTFKFTRDHEWIDLHGDQGRVGITDFAQRQLGNIVYVELPAVGASLTAGKSFGTVESVKAVSELLAPVSGEVTAVNGDLRSAPELLNKDPHGTWMVTVRLTAPGETEGLLDAVQYAELAK